MRGFSVGAPLIEPTFESQPDAPFIHDLIHQQHNPGPLFSPLILLTPHRRVVFLVENALLAAPLLVAYHAPTAFYHNLSLSATASPPFHQMFPLLIIKSISAFLWAIRRRALHSRTYCF